LKKSTLTKRLLLLALAWLCASCSVAVAQQAPVSVGYKMIPTAQWEQLKQNQQELVLKLNEAKLQAITLRKQSETLKNRLTEIEELLTISERELTNSNAHLESARDWQERTQKSLQELTAQIEAERKKQEAIQRRLRAQRTLAYFFLGLVVITK